MTQAPSFPLPATPRDPVRDVLHGETIVDPYRWLEDETRADVQAWVQAQTAHAEAALTARPEYPAISAELARLLAGGSVQAPVQKGDRYFYTRQEGTQPQPVLYVRDGLDGTDRALIDTAALGETVALDWWYPSDDGRLLAYGTSEHGDEWSTLQVLNVDAGTRLPERIARTRYSSVAWEPDGGGFYYTRYPAPGSVPPGEENYHRHVFHHRLGTDPAGDPELFGVGRPMTEMVSVDLSPDGRWLAVFASEGWVRNEVHVRDLTDPAGRFTPVVSGKDALFLGDVRGTTLYLLTNWEAPRYRVLAVDLTHPAADTWREIVPESPDRVLEAMALVGDQLILHAVRDVVSEVAVYTLDGAPQTGPDLPPLGTVTALRGRWDGDAVFIGFESYTVPPTVFRYGLADGTLTRWAAVTAPDGLDALAVEQVWYTSQDGTRIPMFLVGPAGRPRDGDAPTVLTGYGGFNISKSPLFTPAAVLWARRGGLYALPNLRGGSEYGETWHRAGMLGNKQNVFDDFIAAAEHLIAGGYTRRERLGIMGRSNGGLLVGAALTQRPDLFRAVACGVPLLDMLRYHRFRIARLWVAEYGSAENAEQYGWLRAYSPYHHVDPGTAYPAVLFTTADSDSRVDPLHARKMAALLQSLGGAAPVLLRVDTSAGHGVGKPLAKLVAEQAAIWTFLAWQLEQA